MSKFSVGDKVTWTSQAHGTRKTKIGEIAAVVPAGDRSGRPIYRLQDERPGKYLATHIDTNWATRDEESYLVAVESGNTKGTIWLYWPRVSWLRKVEG